jgi:drug/metabolite transporter (DMT)-like permease
MTPSRQGLLAVHSAVFIFGLTALFSKLISLTALEITLLRSVFAVIALWGFIRWQGGAIKLKRRRDYGVAILLGVFLASHWVTYFHAMQVSSVAVGVIALYTFPVITVFLEPLFHGERPHWKDIISALAVLYGIYLLVPEFAIDDTTTQGILWGVLSALLFALRNIVQGRYFPGYPARQALFYQTAITIVVLLPFGGSMIPDVSTWQWGQLLLLGVVFTALPHTLFAHSLLFFKAKTASLIACLQVVYATAFAALVLAEIPSLTTILGGLIIVAAAMYESYTTGRKGN